VLATISVEGYVAAEPSPADTDIVQGLGPDPLLQGLLADLQQDRAAALPFLAHDSHAGLVGDAGLSASCAAAAWHNFQMLHFLAHGFVKYSVGQEDQPVRAGVGVVVFTGSPWTEYARLFSVHSL
jgi:hypothetical protein